ncbi:DDE superfamily endonuclease [Rhizoctonia solani AG-3 Rhs1AP]|uniref:DDE superfamily endonuclease n=2 Tax=Rhizoctonia solani AG-3 TaxID=1086053 RepID=X8JAK8_9AGAM|nr:DDE superfamily endonuclease [Rhizoctonia solani AG-3 Rhs1AP]
MSKNKSGKPILLIMDGHGLHCTDKMIEYGYACVPRVHIFLLPPHTTHKLQPLDCGVFGVAQRRWSKLCDQRAMDGDLLTRDTVVEWMKLRSKFMCEDII